MQKITPVTRISAGLVLLTASILLALDFAGLLPEQHDDTMDRRLAICERLSLDAARAASQSDMTTIRVEIRDAVVRNDDLLSVGLRAMNGQLLMAAGDHSALWTPPPEAQSTRTHVQVPLQRQGEPWATLEVRFAKDTRGWLDQLWERPVIRMLVATSVLAFISFGFYLRKSLRHLDPSAVIPSRVQAALDVMAEGVILIDDRERIVLTNEACGEKLRRTGASMVGRRISELPWRSPAGSHAPEVLPWVDALRESESSIGLPLTLEVTEDHERHFIVNASPVLDGWGRAKGAIITLDDVTELEQKKAELETAMLELEKSRDEIRLQNEELQVMAATDPLTGVANRRSFMQEIDNAFALATERGEDYCVIMADIDHFKKVNDTYGHGAGDDVIRRLAHTLANAARSPHAVCRYGGEEFVIAVPGTPLDAAAGLAEQIRAAVGSPGFAEMPITASFGVASIRAGAEDASQLIDQADEALYVSKNGGRNRVSVYSAALDPGASS